MTLITIKFQTTHKSKKELQNIWKIPLNSIALIKLIKHTHEYVGNGQAHNPGTRNTEAGRLQLQVHPR